MLGRPITRGDFIRTIERLDRIGLPKDCTYQISAVQADRFGGDDCPPADYHVSVTYCLGRPPVTPIILDLAVTHVPTDEDIAKLKEKLREFSRG